MSVYLDASVLLPTVVDEAATAAIDAFVSSPDRKLFVSDFAAAEVASGISRLVRTQAITAANGFERLSTFDAWRSAMTTEVELRGADIRVADMFVRRFELMLRTPDAIHVAACMRLGLALATLDRRLASAAREIGLAVELA